MKTDLNKLQDAIIRNHPVSKAELFIEFLRQRRELQEKVNELDQFVIENFKDEMER